MLRQQELLELAVRGLEAERAKIDELLVELRGQLTGHIPVQAKRATAAKPTGKARAMSAEGRAAIRAALKKRWAAFHAGKGKAPGAKPAKKRTLSSAALAALRKNAAEARAARKAASAR